MRSVDIFIGADTRLRPVWRAVLFLPIAVILFFPVVFVVVVILRPDRVIEESQYQFFVQGVAFMTASLGAAWIMFRVADRQSFHALGFWFYPKWWRDFGFGLALGVVLLTAAVLPLLLAGNLRLEWAGLPVPDILNDLALNLVVFSIAAASEEVLFRGYFFQRMIDGIGAIGAIALLSVVFGLLHHDNPSAGWFSTANTVLMGVLLAVAYLRTRALWVATGLHISWNYFMGAFYSLPVSGLEFRGRPLAYELSGPEWWTGGSYGPEGSVLTTVVALAGTVWLMRTGWLAVSPEQQSALEWHPTEREIP